MPRFKPENFPTDAVRWLVHPLTRLAAEIDLFDVRGPATLLHKVRKEFSQAGKRMTTSDIAGMRKLLADPSVIDFAKKNITDGCREFKRKASADKRSSLLLKLIADADKKVPYVSFVALLGIESDDHFRRLCEPADLMIQAEKAKGEVKARAVIRALRETAEMLYEPYLRVLWSLYAFSKGELPRFPGAFGSLVNQVGEALRAYPNLVDPDAAWLRNAASHANWIYLPGSDELRTWDRHRRVREFSVAVLSDKQQKMYQIAGPTLFYLRHLYVMRNIGVNTGLFDVILRLASASTQDEFDRVTQEFQVLAGRIFGPVKSFCASIVMGSHPST